MRDDIRGLGAQTTLRLGGPARRVVTATTDQQIMQMVRDADRAHEPILVLAGGSNLVVADAGFDGTAVLLRTTGLSAQVSGDDDVVVTVAAGEPWDSVVARTVAEKWSGLECLSGIPGSAGATPIQNVGAYGQEVAERITAVRVYDRHTDEIRTMTGAECGFGYRTSVFKHVDRWIVLSVDFRLTRSARSAPIRYAELATALDVPIGESADATAARDAVLALRRRKGMVLDVADRDTYSVGSFFMNPVLSPAEFTRFAALAVELGPPPAWPGVDGTTKVSAAWLIEKAGFTKGYGHGSVSISTKHTLALTNRGGGTTTELLALAREIRDGVEQRFGVTLRPEPVLVNCSL